MGVQQPEPLRFSFPFLRELSATYHGKTRRRVESGSIEDGQDVATSYTVSEPSFMERVRAIDVLSKLAGDYDKRRVEADGALLEYRALVKGVFKGIGIY